MRNGAVISVLLTCAVCACSQQTTAPARAIYAPPGRSVDQVRLNAAAAEPQNWFTGGRDQDGTYFSPLKSINDGNVARLGFAWSYDLGTHRGQEATPLVVDGVMYTSGTWGYVYALAAATGRELWRFDPHADFAAARNPCCDMVNRGVALWQGRLYVVSVDGKLHALDPRSGRELWLVDTITDHTLPYSSTGAPQVAGQVVVIGNSGADMGHGAVRGYVSAYNLETGTLKWRFYTVPGAPGQPYEHPELAVADKTWGQDRDPKFKGGATVWDGMAYDPQLNLVYFGTSNAAPYDLRQVGTEHSDALFAASIIAVHADTGRMAWYYQETPGDHWDYDATQKLTLADLPINGATRSVIMQASKNGFFYVLDRRTGELLSAEPFSYVNWASGVDMKSGRPVETPQSDWYDGPKNIFPSWSGAHNWPPMAFDPASHLVYIPVIDASNVVVELLKNGGRVKFIDGSFTANGITPDDMYDAASMKSLFGPLPELKDLKRERTDLVREVLRAWDPLTHNVVWEHETSSGVRGYDGGVLSTAGNLVFQGRGSGELWAYAANTGAVLKVIPTGSHIMAAPMSYAVDGVQYVAVQAGYGGAGISVGAIPRSSAASKYQNVNRIIAFRLGGGTVPPPPPLFPIKVGRPPPNNASPDTIRRGEVLFVQECSRCHVMGVSIIPDLRNLDPAVQDVFKQIVLLGAVAPTGMEKFDDVLSEADVNAIHAYVLDEAWKAYRAQPTAH